MSAVRLKGLLTAPAAWAAVRAGGAGPAGAADTYWNAATGGAPVPEPVSACLVALLPDLRRRLRAGRRIASRRPGGGGPW